MNELGVVIGRPCKNVSPQDALSYVLGYTCVNDVSARDWQKEKGGGQFCRGKVLTPFVRSDRAWPRQTKFRIHPD